MSQRFEFGKNWEEFILRNLSDERVAIARQHILEFLEVPNLSGLRVLDIGCGSGLHSCAMLKAGATEIVAFDYDPRSVAASRYVYAHAGQPSNWTILQGSVLDQDFMRGLGTFELVYSWGVLHHTGDVWTAIRNAAQAVAPGGRLYIALYSADVQKPPYTAEFWLNTKKRYLRASWIGKRLWEAWYIWRFLLGGRFWRIGEFFRLRAEHRKNRGMDIMTDIRDWLGGWPMEFCKDADVLEFCTREFGMELRKIKTGEANTEFCFVLPSANAA